MLAVELVKVNGAPRSIDKQPEKCIVNKMGVECFYFLDSRRVLRPALEGAWVLKVLGGKAHLRSR